MLARLTVCLLVSVLGAPASAEPYVHGDLSVHRPWSRALPAVAPNGGAYFHIENGGDEAVHIVSAASTVAGRVELHTHEMDGGLMKMRHIDSVEVPARGAVTFKPGGLHVMLIGLKTPLVAGERFPLTLEFENAGAIDVMVEVTNQEPAAHGDHGGGHGGGHGQTE